MSFPVWLAIAFTLGFLCWPVGVWIFGPRPDGGGGGGPAAAGADPDPPRNEQDRLADFDPCI